MSDYRIDTVIGLDLGTNCGYAYTNNLKIHPTLSGVWNLAPHKRGLEGGGMRFVRFRQNLLELIRCSENRCAVFFEEVKRHGIQQKKGSVQVTPQTKSAQVYGGFMYMLAAVCDEHDIPYQGLGVGEIKKSATGKGNASKERMMGEAQRKWGLHGQAGPEWDPEENQADALWILYCGMRELGLDPD
jgi:hypothetical protein